MDSTIIIITLVILAIASLIGGIISLVKFAKTKNKLMLVLGIIFTFIVPAILLYFAFKIWTLNTVIMYGPAPAVIYGPSPPAK